jgi:hypothetical protein
MNLDQRVGQFHQARWYMAISAAGKKARLANKALYAPKAKPPPERPHPRVPETHSVGDEALKKIIQRVLAELKLPGKIPSEVIFAALAELRDMVEQATQRR